MIPQAFITEWSQTVPWQTNEQVEQDLVICRALISIFSDDWLSSSLAFRGGTALHKLYLSPQQRYSEDIDLVQLRPEPIKETIKRLQEKLSFLGEATVSQKNSNNTLKYRFESEVPPIQNLRLKIETNCREHFTVMGLKNFPFEINNSWFNGKCEITTYNLEELLGTKLRALYQRKKGRDLYDIYKALNMHPHLDRDLIIKCYKEYMQFSVDRTPSQKIFLQNMETKIMDSEFAGDVKGILRPLENFDHTMAYETVRKELLEKI